MVFKHVTLIFVLNDVFYDNHYLQRNINVHCGDLPGPAVCHQTEAASQQPLLPPPDWPAPFYCCHLIGRPLLGPFCTLFSHWLQS